MVVKQIKTSFDNFSYIIYCPSSRESAVVDPSYETSELLSFIKSKNLDLRYIINTHYHRDHTAGNEEIKRFFSNAKIVAAKEDSKHISSTEIFVSDGKELKLGKIKLSFLVTPGHTKDSICIVVDNKALLTGDTLFIDDCGRCDLPGGSISEMFKSLQRIKKLPDNLIVYPGHDYGKKPFDLLGNQKRVNKTLLAKNLTEFSKI